MRIIPLNIFQLLEVVAGGRYLATAAQTWGWKSGSSGVGRGTGGGGSGIAACIDIPGYYRGPSESGAGSAGTSYSGGCGGGFCESWDNAHGVSGEDASGNRRCRRAMHQWS